jgi:hypothetical protein
MQADDLVVANRDTRPFAAAGLAFVDPWQATP